jgi:SAM-dependent methyltransferase
MTLPHAGLEASDWVRRWSRLVPAGATVLDLACGSGRHVRWFTERGARVTAVDRDADAVAPLSPIAEILVADLEAGPWPLEGRRFDAVIVTNYLWRALLPRIVAAVGEGGVLIYETFSTDHAGLGKPSNPAFLLRPGELLEAAVPLRIVAYEDGYAEPPPRAIQRICAVRETTSPARHLL